MSDIKKDYTSDEIENHLGDESTPSSTLHSMARHVDAHHETFKAIAQHPNTSEATLGLLHSRLGEIDHANHKEVTKEITAHPNAPSHLVTDVAARITAKPEGYKHSSHGHIMMHDKLSPDARKEMFEAVMRAKEPSEDDHMSSWEHGYSREALMRDWMKSPHATAKQVDEYVRHPNHAYAKSAVMSPQANEDHEAAYLQHPEAEVEDLIENKENLSPKTIRAAYEKYKKAPKKKGEDDSDRRKVLAHIAGHQNVPDDIHAELAKPDPKAKDQDEHSYNWRANPRLEALKNPKHPIDKLVLDMRSGDKEAHAALRARPDTDKDTLREMNGKIEPVSSDKHPDHNVVRSILNHPNTPDDVLSERLKQNTSFGEAVLNRKNLSPDVLKKLVDHKNQDLAIKALDHNNVTEDVVQHAYKRKAADVSRAASTHELATPEMQMERAKADPLAAAAVAKDHQDPKVLRELYKQHSDDHGVVQALTANKSTPTDVVEKISKHYGSDNWMKQEDGYNRGRRKELNGLAEHPNHSEKSLIDIGQHHPRTAARQLSQEGLNTLVENTINSDQGDKKDRLKDIATHSLYNDKITPEHAIRAVSGKLGGHLDRQHFTGLAEKVRENPKAFTPEVLDAAREVPSEFRNEALISALSQSPALKDEHREKLFGESIKGLASENDDDHDLHHSTLKGLLQHKDAKPEQLDTILNAGDDDAHGSMDLKNIAAANPNLSDEKFKEHITGDNLGSHAGENQLKNLAGVIHDRGAAEHVAEHGTDPGLIEKVARHSKDSWGNRPPNAEITEAALKNPNIDVQRHAASEMLGDISNDSEKQRIADELLKHPDEEVRKAAFGSMSPKGQKEYMDKFGSQDPNVIRGMNHKSLESLKITPEMSHEAINAVVDHNARTDKHLDQAVAHSPGGALSVLKKLRGDTSRSRVMKANQKDQIAKYEQKAIDTHPEHHGVLSDVAKNTKNDQTVRKILNDPKTVAKIGDDILNNPLVKPTDLDKFASLDPVEHKDLYHKLAQSDKTSVKMLGHIAESSPEFLPDLAANERAASPKVIKAVLKSNNLDALTELARNSKVPAGIKDEILKNPAVAIKLDPSKIPHDQMDVMARENDPQVQQALVDSESLPQHTLSYILDHTMKNMGDAEANPQRRAILEGVSKHPDLSVEDQAKLSELGPDYVKNVIESQAGQTHVPSVLDAIDRHGPDGAKTILKALYKHYNDYGNNKINSADVADKMIDLADLDDSPDDQPTSAHMMTLMKKNNAFGEPQVRKLAAKVMAQRPADYQYDKSPAEQSRKHRDAQLMNEVVQRAPEDMQSQFAENPNMRAGLLMNPKLKPDLQKQVVKSLVDSADRHFDGLSYSALSNTFKGLAKNKHTTPEQVDSLWQKLKKSEDPQVKTGFYDEFAESKKITPEIAEQIWHDGGRQKVLSNPAFPKDHLGEVLASADDDETMQAIAKNPNFSLNLPNMPTFENMHQEHQRQVSEALAKNFHAQPEDLQRVYQHRLRDTKHKDGSVSGGVKKLAAEMIKNPNLSASTARDMMAKNVVNNDDIVFNPAIGGEVFRSREHKFPTTVPGLEGGKEINEATFKHGEDKVKQVMGMIPDNGYIEYGQFKKEQPGLANNPLILNMFKSDKQMRVTKAVAENYLKQMPEKKFHVSYEKWDGMQRHDNMSGEDNKGNNQLVFQINNHDQQDKALLRDKNQNGLYRFVQQAQFSSGHPVNGQSIGWSRVDTHHPEDWLVEEIQSDFNAGLSQELNKIQKDGQSHHMTKYGIDPDQSEPAVRGLMDTIQGWDRAAMNNVIETAKAHGRKRVFIHSGESKTAMNKGDKGAVTAKYDKIYNKLPQEMGFRPARYEDFKGHDPDSRMKGQQMWVLDLNPQASQVETLPESPVEKPNKKPKKSA